MKIDINNLLDLPKRFKEVRIKLSINQEEVAAIIGYGQSMVSQYESIDFYKKNKKNVPYKYIKTFCEKLNVNRKWLETGEGEIFLPNNQQLLKENVEKLSNDIETIKNKSSYVYPHTPTSRYMEIIKQIQESFGESFMKNEGEIQILKKPVKLYDKKFSASLIKEFKSDHPAEAMIWTKNNLFEDCHTIAKVRGNRMSGEIEENAWIGIREIPNWMKRFKIGGIHGIIVENEFDYIGYINLGKDENTLEISFTNPLYKPIEIEKSDITSFWEVKVNISPVVPKTY